MDLREAAGSSAPQAPTYHHPHPLPPISPLLLRSISPRSWPVTCLLSHSVCLSSPCWLTVRPMAGAQPGSPSFLLPSHSLHVTPPQLVLLRAASDFWPKILLRYFHPIPLQGPYQQICPQPELHRHLGPRPGSHPLTGLPRLPTLTSLVVSAAERGNELLTPGALCSQQQNVWVLGPCMSV